jgi:hypothetical protein
MLLAAEKGETMVGQLKVGVFAVALVACPLLGFAAGNIPDIKGVWVGKTDTIVVGSGGHFPSNKGTFEKPGLFESDIRVIITGQEGRRFWGVKTISVNGEKTDEPFIGELYGSDNRRVLIADTDGYINGDIRGDVFSYCYAHAGGPTKTSLVACNQVKRAR